MISHLALATAALVATTASASNFIFLSAHDVLSKPYVPALDPPTLLLARQVSNEPPSSAKLPSSSSSAPASTSDTPTTEPSVSLNPDGSLNFTAWDAATSAACAKKLSSLVISSNPAGACICYNLPSLDAATGAFEADLRLYRVSEPRGAFAGVDPADVRVGLEYNGASVSPVSSDGLTGGEAAGNASSLARRVDKGPSLLQAYMFVGQIDKKHLSDNMSMAALETLLMPTLTLKAPSQPGVPPALTTVSLNEAAFLTGVFSNQVVQSDFAAAQAAVDRQVAAMKNGTAPFVMPGTQFMIFPVGLLVTALWMVLGVAAYAIGTYERVAYRGMYERRVAFRGKGN